MNKAAEILYEFQLKSMDLIILTEYINFTYSTLNANKNIELIKCNSCL
jgi:hypothetical protein